MIYFYDHLKKDEQYYSGKKRHATPVNTAVMTSAQTLTLEQA
ncbi:hypothetical protein [Acinetobacter calcoaceticus]|nr:hypothetical protein [Acinetobacter calcoaceticus]